MAYEVANVNIAVDTFNSWVTKTNVVLDQLTNYIVTANNEANGSLTTGNGFVIGILGANTICVPSSLRGGNVQASDTLNITSATVVGNTFTVNSSASQAYLNTNTHIQSSNVYVNAAAITLYNASGSVTVKTPTVTVNATTITVDDANINSNLTIRTDLGLFVSSNTDIGSNTTTPQTVYAFDKSVYSSGKITAQSKKGANVNISEILVAYEDSGNTSQLTVYGSVKAPTSANLGVYSVSSNATHVLLNFTQTQQNTAVKIVANLIK